MRVPRCSIWLPCHRLVELAGGSREKNTAIAVGVLNGESGSCRDTVLFNAGAALCVGGAAASIEAGVRPAREAIDSGRALETLNLAREMTNSCSASLTLDLAHEPKR
jgi:anthranilate phosphoribosyltransferase